MVMVVAETSEDTVAAVENAGLPAARDIRMEDAAGMAVEESVLGACYTSSAAFRDGVVDPQVEEDFERFEVAVPVAVLGDQTCCMEVVLLGQSRRSRLDCVGGRAAAVDFLSGLNGLLEHPELSRKLLSTP